MFLPRAAGLVSRVRSRERNGGSILFLSSQRKHPIKYIDGYYPEVMD